MEINLSKQKTKLGNIVDWNHLIDLSLTFKFRDITNERRYCVYIWYDEITRKVYIGQGIYSRPFNHNKDELKRNINSRWMVSIIAYGLSKEEALVLESYYIRLELSNGQKLLKKNAEWKGDTLINKTKGTSDKRFNELKKIYLKDSLWK